MGLIPDKYQTLMKISGYSNSKVFRHWPILKFVGKDILKFVGNCRRAVSMAWLISGGRLHETRGGFSAEC